MAVRLGIVDYDPSHVVAFTQRLHHTGIGEDHRVGGAPPRPAAVGLPA